MKKPSFDTYFEKEIYLKNKKELIVQLYPRPHLYLNQKFCEYFELDPDSKILMRVLGVNSFLNHP